MIAKQTTKIGAVEGIRGLACLMVFLSHLSSTFAPSMHTGSQGGVKTSLDMLLHHSPFAFIYSGAAAVGIFFVLSGFILGYAILEKDDIVGNASAMFVKRYFRLMPVALFSSVVAFFIFRYTTPDTSDLGQWAINYDIKNPSIFDAIYYGSVTPFFSGSAPYNWSLWTMKIEIFGSAIICLLACVLSRIKFKKTVILICMITPFFMNIKRGDDIYYSSFMAGFFIYHLDIRLTTAKSVSLLIAGLYLCGFHTTSYFYHWLHLITSLEIDGRALDNYGFYNNVGGLLVVFSVLKGELLSKIMSIRPFVYMGTLSFSVYALHQPIMHFTCPAIYNAMKSHGMTYGYSALVASVVTVLACYIVAVPTNKYIDNFSVRLSNNIKKLAIK